MAKPSRRRFDLRYLPGVTSVAIACFVLLYIPMLVLVGNSVNAGAVIGRWEGFSFRWYGSALHNEAFRDAATNTLLIAIVAATIATVTGTMAALATTRARNFRYGGLIYLIINQPLMVPEIVVAIALLIILAVVKQATGYSGGLYLMIAHSTFCIPFAYMPIRARLESMDNNLEMAAADLYASAFYTFRRVTFPLLAPGILAGFMLAFVISLDDVVISEFIKSPGQETLPTYLLSELRRNVSSEIYAISSLLLGLSVLIVAGSYLLSRRQE